MWRMLEVPLRRVDCLNCGVTTEQVRWLPERSRLTTRLIAHVEALLRLLPIRHIQQLVGLHWHTIRAIDARRLSREVQPSDLSCVRRLIMDELTLFKGHPLRHGRGLQHQRPGGHEQPHQGHQTHGLWVS